MAGIVIQGFPVPVIIVGREMGSDLETRPAYICRTKNFLTRWLANNFRFIARVIPQLSCRCRVMDEQQKRFLIKFREVDHPIPVTKCHMDLLKTLGSPGPGAGRFFVLAGWHHSAAGYVPL